MTVDRAATFVVIAAVWAALAAVSARTIWWSYDEGVYGTAAARWAAGETPYTDFFCPQPVGVIAAGAVAELAGMGVTGPRFAAFVCGLGTLAGTFHLGREASAQAGLADPTGCGLAAAAFAAVGIEVVYAAGEAATLTPAACATVWAVLPLFGRWRWRHLLAGIGVGCATVFRLQPASLAPGLAVAILCLDGWRAGLGGVARFAAGLAAGLVAIHLPPLMTWHGYGWCVFGFQASQPRMNWADRMSVSAAFVTQPAAFLGLAAAIGAVFSGRPAVRAVAWIGLLGVGVAVTTGGFLHRTYFVQAQPFVAVSAAVWAAGRWQQAWGRPTGFGVAAAALSAVAAVEVGVLLAQIEGRVPSQRAFREELRAAPGNVWLCMDGRRPLAAGKRPVGGWASADPGSQARDPAAVQAWLIEGTAADGVAVTELMTLLASPETARRVLDSGKPVLYESPAVRDTFLTLAGER